jgi:hypothetical protein
MVQVKVFYEYYVGMLEEKMNRWLQDTKGTIEIINVSSDSTGESKIVYIFYKEKNNGTTELEMETSNP